MGFLLALFASFSHSGLLRKMWSTAPVVDGVLDLSKDESASKKIKLS